MKIPNPSISVGQCVVMYPETAEVFDEFGIDYSCEGARTVADACLEQQISSELLLKRLEQQVGSRTLPQRSRWSDSTLAEICDTLEWEHDQILQQLLPGLVADSEIVSNEAEMGQTGWMVLEQSLVALQAALESQSRREETALFPAIREMEYSWAAPGLPTDSVAELCRTIRAGHNHIGEQMRQLRRTTAALSDGSQNGPACRSLLRGLSELQCAVRQHLHEENNILFPRAIRMEMCSGSL